MMLYSALSTFFILCVFSQRRNVCIVMLTLRFRIANNKGR
ncbi:unnamed protein product [Phytomonas sp. EM1]|nr:unnamed protein product [Phytomonas sp. EM1]|eukprot:CCW61405.1 unnamed protein product [Phytomonas sp. isolate EM1]